MCGYGPVWPDTFTLLRAVCRAPGRACRTRLFIMYESTLACAANVCCCCLEEYPLQYSRGLTAPASL